jgi:hypothetical protein
MMQTTILLNNSSIKLLQIMGRKVSIQRSTILK